MVSKGHHFEEPLVSREGPQNFWRFRPSKAGTIRAHPAFSSGAPFFTWFRIEVSAKHEWLMTKRKGPWEACFLLRERDDVWVRGRNSSVISGIENGRFYGYACRFTCIRTKRWWILPEKALSMRVWRHRESHTTNCIAELSRASVCELSSGGRVLASFRQLFFQP